jgi:hypothetical protein
MILRATKKLATKLNINSLRDFEGQITALEEWYGDSFSVGNLEFILLTNAFSLYSKLIPGKGITDLRIFEEAIANRILVYKTANRSVVGSMNDMISHTKFYMTNYKMSLSEISDKLNKMPFSYLKYKSPLEMI